MDAERLRAKAREYELKALAFGDRPSNEDKHAALVFAAVGVVLYELADLAESELREAA